MPRAVQIETQSEEQSLTLLCAQRTTGRAGRELALDFLRNGDRSNTNKAAQDMLEFCCTSVCSWVDFRDCGDSLNR